jgi:antitoxin component YwqK of YwqJK toxin-antitoxin module
MKRIYFIVTVFTILLSACNNQSEKEQTESEKHIADSLSKAEQRKKADSLKRDNPLLIMPPDSNYTGDYIDKYDNGIIKFKGFFRFGERHGQWMSFYPMGTLWSELHFDKGLRHGLNITYFKNGKKRYEGSYKNNKQDSVWNYYDTSGVLAEKVFYKNDVIVKKLPLK